MVPAKPLLTPTLWRVLVGGVAVSLALLVTLGLLVGRSWGSTADTPAAGSVEVGFAQDMQAHHRQAVEMSTLVRDRTDDPDVRQLALDIALTQQQQAGQMFAWLETWGVGQGRTEPVMAWMDEVPGGHAGHEMEMAEGGLGSVAEMPGMATAEQMARLEAADGVEAERIYLQLMATHHVAGVEMAEAGAEGSELPVVQRLATAMATGQQSELLVLDDLLAERGGPLDDL
jgi:uncharacterized protein (DUF305 family)